MLYKRENMMNIDRTKQYLEKRLNYLKHLTEECENKKNVFEIEKKELFTQIEIYKNKIDEAYNVFSPKSTKNDFINEQINLFETRVNCINQNIEEVQGKIDKGKGEIIEIEAAILELNTKMDETEEIISILNEIELEREKEIECINIEKENDLEEFKEYRVYENSVDFEKIEIERRKIRDIIYKCENCSVFMDMDINRSKVELGAIIYMLEGLLK